MRLRVKAGSRLVESSRNGWPRAFEIGDNFGPRRLQQRPHDADAGRQFARGRRCRAAPASPSRAAGGAAPSRPGRRPCGRWRSSGRRRRAATSVNQPIADAAGRRLQVGAVGAGRRRHVDAMQPQAEGRNAGGREAGVKVGRERLIGVALGAAQLMIQMGNGDGKGADGSRAASRACSSATLSGPPETAATTPRAWSSRDRTRRRTPIHQPRRNVPHDRLVVRTRPRPSL